MPQHQHILRRGGITNEHFCTEFDRWLRFPLVSSATLMFQVMLVGVRAVAGYLLCIESLNYRVLIAEAGSQPSPIGHLRRHAVTSSTYIDYCNTFAY